MLSNLVYYLSPKEYCPFQLMPFFYFKPQSCLFLDDSNRHFTVISAPTLVKMYSMFTSVSSCKTAKEKVPFPESARCVEWTVSSSTVWRYALASHFTASLPSFHFKLYEETWCFLNAIVFHASALFPTLLWLGCLSPLCVSLKCSPLVSFWSLVDLH